MDIHGPKEGCNILILSRRYMERVILKLEDGRTITVTIAQVERGKVRLGFDAPPGVVILREELLPPTPAYSKES